MGCASSCSIFEECSCAREWIAHTKGGITHIVRVLDDVLILSGQNKNVCNQDVYAQTTMTFLGIELNTIAMEARLPLDEA